MFEVFHCASWRSNNGFKAFPTSSHTQIFDIWSQKQNFPLGSLEDHLQGIKFPIISDRDGDFSRSFGVLKIYNDETGADRFGAARALIILNEEMKMVYLALNNETTPSKPENVLSLLRTLKAKDPNCDKESSKMLSSASSSLQSQDQLSND